METEMNFSESLTNTTFTNVSPRLYTCVYKGYFRGKTSCLETEECKPMTTFLQILSSFGFVSNLSVFILICAIERLHKPIYTGIRMLTIPDALFLFNSFLLFTFQHMPTRLKIAIIYILFASLCSSIGHVILLSAQQYLMIAYPLQCLVWIRNRRIIIISVIIWAISSMIAFPYVYLTFLVNAHDAAAMINIVYTVLLSAGPISVLAVLHVMKIIALKKSLVNNSSRTTQKVSRVISVVVGVYVITTAPINIRDIIEMSVCLMIDSWFVVLGHIGRTLLLVNYSINPYIYFISTPQFKRAVIYCFKSDKRRNHILEPNNGSAQALSKMSDESSCRSPQSSSISTSNNDKNDFVSTRL